MSQSGIRAMICVRKIDIDSSIQARWVGEVMSRNWRIYGLSDTLVGMSHRDGGRSEACRHPRLCTAQKDRCSPVVGCLGSIPNDDDNAWKEVNAMT